ncbi:hypothetical protein FOL47_006546 [Perkinsus chesapeaki]|uniref:EF-hand domain-containing protein n=1 Tax=Perkinsus chesapeaki TaxID=330153 RepID=A0A7J6LR01_PERCH|nr:hypothetical protein FOL47_006546 [Perkinsus chesapeaki]
MSVSINEDIIAAARIEGIRRGTVTLRGAVDGLITTTTEQGEGEGQGGGYDDDITPPQYTLMNGDSGNGYEIRQMRKLLGPFFHYYDVNKDHTIDYDEFKMVMKDMNERITGEELYKLFKEADVDNSDDDNNNLTTIPTTPRRRSMGCNNDEDEDDEGGEDDIPEDLADLTPQEQQKRIKLRSAYMMGIDFSLNKNKKEEEEGKTLNIREVDILPHRAWNMGRGGGMLGIRIHYELSIEDGRSNGLRVLEVFKHSPAGQGVLHRIPPITIQEGDDDNKEDTEGDEVSKAVAAVSIDERGNDDDNSNDYDKDDIKQPPHHLTNTPMPLPLVDDDDDDDDERPTAESEDSHREEQPSSSSIEGGGGGGIHKDVVGDRLVDTTCVVRALLALSRLARRRGVAWDRGWAGEGVHSLQRLGSDCRQSADMAAVRGGVHRSGSTYNKGRVYGAVRMLRAYRVLTNTRYLSNSRQSLGSREEE